MGCNLLRVRGLPFSTTATELKQFFEGYGVTGTYLGMRNGKPTGEAYVEFKDADEASKAHSQLQHGLIGSRYLEIFEAVEASLVAAAAGEGGPKASLAGCVVRLRGLPFTASAEDVIAFLAPVEPVGGEAGIAFTCTPDGRPTGEAYFEVASEEDQATVLAKHKEQMGSRYIEVFHSSKGDWFAAIQQRGFFTAPGGQRRHHPPIVQPASGGSAPGGSTPPGGRSRGGSMEDVQHSFAGFSLSHRDMQVPGPPRSGYGGGTYDDRQYSSRPPMAHVVAGLAPGRPAWGPMGPMPPPGVSSGGRPLLFNPAPGPAGTKQGGRGNGGGRGGGPGGYDYSRQPVLVAPFMMQHPFMQQQPGGWGGGMMPGQQVPGGQWYGPAVPQHGGMAMGMYPNSYAHQQHVNMQQYYAEQQARAQQQQQQQHARPQHYRRGSYGSSGRGGGTPPPTAPATSVTSESSAATASVKEPQPEDLSPVSPGAGSAGSSTSPPRRTDAADPSPLQADLHPLGPS